jgi:hypothetical protein
MPVIASIGYQIDLKCDGHHEIALNGGELMTKAGKIGRIPPTTLGKPSMSRSLEIWIEAQENGC